MSVKIVLSVLHRSPTSCDRITYFDSSNISSSWILFLSDSSSGKYRSINSSARTVTLKFLVANNCDNKSHVKWYQVVITPTGRWSPLSWLLFCTCEKGVAGHLLFGWQVLPGNTIKNWTLEDFVLKGLLFSERPGCSCIFPSIMSFWSAHRAMGITVTFSSTDMMDGFCFFTQPSWDSGKSASKRLVSQTVTEASFGSHEHRERSSGPWIPETRVHQRTGEVCLSAREDTSMGKTMEELPSELPRTLRT